MLVGVLSKASHPSVPMSLLSRAQHVLASAARTLKLVLYLGAQKGLGANLKLGLPGTVAHSNLSFRRFENQRKKISRMPVRDMLDQRGKYPPSEQKQNLG